MSDLYKIEGENEFAYFRADLLQLRQIFERDPNWVAGVTEIFGHYGISKAMQGCSNSRFACKIEEHRENYFEVRGTVSLYYRVEAVNVAVCRIVPVGKLLTIHKIAIPFQLAIVCLFPVVFTPLFYKVQRNKIEWTSKAHIEALCKYLQIRGQQLFGQHRPGR